MTEFIQYTVFGVMLGAGYAIAATGLVVTYTTSGVFNFAQGAVGMIAAFCYWELVVANGLPILVALLIILVWERPSPAPWSSGCSCAACTAPPPSGRSS